MKNFPRKIASAFDRRLNKIHQLFYDASVKDVRRIQYSRKTIREEGYYSQYGQEKFILEELLNFKKDGVFIDIGASDGVNISNTYYLEKNLGWTGIAIEPIPASYQILQSRRNCITINGCVAALNGTAKFLSLENAEVLSGIVDQYDARHLRRIENHLERFGGEKNYIDVDCFTLQSIFEKYQIKEVDYLSLDTEGGELEILKTLDLVKDVPIQIIDVENNYYNREFQKLLNKYDYQLVALIGCDEIYQKR